MHERKHFVNGVDELGRDMAIACFEIEVLALNLEELVERRHQQRHDQENAKEKQNHAKEKLRKGGKINLVTSA